MFRHPKHSPIESTKEVGHDGQYALQGEPQAWTNYVRKQNMSKLAEYNYIFQVELNGRLFRGLINSRLLAKNIERTAII